MRCITGNGVSICGNFAEYTKKKPKDWFERGYKMIVPFNFKWRAKLGKVTCDCKTVQEHYQPWYGTSWYHSDKCAIRAHLKRYPGIQNFFWDSDPTMIASTD